MIPAAALVLALLASPARAAEAPLLEILDRRTISPASFIPAAGSGKAVPLALVVEAGSGWDGAGVLESVLGKASAIFGQCGLSLGAAEVLTVRWSAEGLRRLNVQDPYKGPAQMAVMNEPLLPARRPVGFLFAKSVPTTASAYNGDSVSRLSGMHPRAKLLLNTFWITINQEIRARPPDISESYSVFAHELTHLFGNVGHTPASPNLMTDASTRGAKSGALLEEQCVEIRKLHGL